jgi:predicted nucleic acid-binding protein
MILLDTGPLVALFDPKDADHRACHAILRTLTEPLTTTSAVLTEALHFMNAGSQGARGVQDFVLSEFVSVVSPDRAGLERCFELMDKYADRPMDFADATLVWEAERSGTGKVLTLDLGDFRTYRYRRGHRQRAFTLLGAELL